MAILASSIRALRHVAGSVASIRSSLRLPKVADRFRYNEDLNKWFWFAVETLVSAVVGTLIAFVFGGNYWAAIYTFAILMAFFILLLAVVAFLENRVSILSIMNQGLKDGKYEDVIKFGSAMRGTLFTSNKNDDIVILGARIDDAASKIEGAHYNKQQGDYVVTVDGTPKSITQIRVGLKIDDLGWSMHLCKRTEEAVANITEGMKTARYHATRLSRSSSRHSQEAIAPLVQLILRGYRHLSGIYYENVDEHWRATFYEDVTKAIFSNCRNVSTVGACEAQSGKPRGTTCSVFCDATYDTKITCARKNILAMYFRSDETNQVSGDDPAISFSRLGLTHAGLMSQAEIEDDIRLYNLLPQATRHGIAREQCYAWGRNIVKKLQNGMHRRGELDFLADVEISSLVAEARAFSQIYYYGTAAVPLNDDFDSVIRQAVVGKSELRYASLMAEIELVNLLIAASDSGERDTAFGRNTNVERLITNLRSTREMCRDKRADLYVRASLHLMTAYHLEYNLNYRYLTNDTVGRSMESRRQKLTHCLDSIDRIYEDIVSYEHKADEDVRRKYALVVQDLRKAEDALNRKYQMIATPEGDSVTARFAGLDSASYSAHHGGSRLNAAMHDFSAEAIQRIKAKWECE